MTAIKFLSETKDTVTLRRADFKNLVEAAETARDLAAVTSHRAYENRVGWDVARRNYLTGEETRRLLDGESPVRVWRKKRGLAQRSLAKAAKVSPSYLAEIETRKKPGSADTICRIADVLNIRMDLLVERFDMSADSALVHRSRDAEKRLLRLLKSNPESVVNETQTIIDEWVTAANRNGTRNWLRAKFEGLAGNLRAELNALAQRDGQTRDPAELRRLTRKCAALEDAVKVLGRKSREF